MRNITTENIVALKAEIQKEIKNSPEGRYYHRLIVVLLCLNGTKPKEAAELFNEKTGTIYYWLREIASGGLIALRDEIRPGRTPRLNFSQKQEIDAALSKTPLDYGYEDCSWDGNVLSDFIIKTYKVTLKTRQCQRLMRELGYTMQRPRVFPHGSNEDDKESFKKT